MSAHPEALFWRARQTPTFDLAAFRAAEGDTDLEYQLTTSGSRLPPEAGTRRSPGDTPIALESAAHHSRGRSVPREDGASGRLPVAGAPSIFRWFEIVTGAALIGGSVAAVLFAIWLNAP